MIIWEKMYAGIYHATCNSCGHSDNGWFYHEQKLHGRTLCSKCYQEQGGK